MAEIKTAASLISALEDERKKFESGLKLKEDILKALPGSLEVHRLSIDAGVKAKARLILDSHDINDALKRLLVLLPAEPVVLVRNACTSFIPEVAWQENDRDQALTVGPTLWHAEMTSEREGIKTAMQWWSILGGHIVHVDVRLKETDATFFREEIKNGRGEVVERRWVLQGGPRQDYDEMINWAPLDKKLPGEKTLYQSFR